MKTVVFSDVVTRCNTKEDRHKTSKLYYVGGEHILSNEMKVLNRGLIEGSTIGPMFYCGFKKGDILFVTRNPHLRKCGMVDFDGICSEKTFVLETKDKNVLLQEYLAIIMQSDDFWTYCDENKSGGVNFFVNWSTLAEYEFSLPPLDEQKRLAEKLWAAYEVKQSYINMIAATEEMVKSQFIEMFEGDKYPHMTLEEISIDWLKGQPFKKNDMNDDGNSLCIHYGELFTKYGPVIKNVVSRTNTEPKRVSKAGDILFPASDVTPNGLARCSMLNEDNVILGGDIIVLRPKDTYNPGYLSYAINQQTSQLLQRVNGGVVKHMSAKALKTVHIPMPPRDKQDEYIAVARQADKSKSKLRNSIESINKVIKSLINDNQ